MHFTHVGFSASFLFLFRHSTGIISTLMIYRLILAVFSIITIVIIGQTTAYAQPYGMGAYSSNTSYGSQTSLSLSATSGVSMAIDPSTVGTLATASGGVTVYSTDVVGYKLYIKAVGSTAMTMGGASIPSSSNITTGSLLINTWGYNTTGGVNFVGVTTTDTLLRSAIGPYSTGDTTTVTYGLNVDRRKAAGSYVSNVIYTAVPQTN